MMGAMMGAMHARAARDALVGVGHRCAAVYTPMAANKLAKR